ncbi:hypothetical protein ACF1AX_31450 [Streptomyces sp. NPDC014802]|uniref:hypothetical protein n=1 Tax=Streptomyces sp. NPDC014802 TaxID=3364917 RepID=UPI0036FAE49C
MHTSIAHADLVPPRPTFVPPLHIARAQARQALNEANALDLDTANSFTIASHFGGLCETLREVLDALDAEDTKQDDQPPAVRAEDIAETQRIITTVPSGPWRVEASEHGAPVSVGPICWLETYDGDHQVPVIEFISHAREALPRYMGEVSRLRQRAALLERMNGGARHGR